MRVQAAEAFGLDQPVAGGEILVASAPEAEGAPRDVGGGRGTSTCFVSCSVAFAPR